VSRKTPPLGNQGSWLVTMLGPSCGPKTIVGEKDTSGVAGVFVFASLTRPRCSSERTLAHRSVEYSGDLDRDRSNAR